MIYEGQYMAVYARFSSLIFTEGISGTVKPYRRYGIEMDKTDLLLTSND